MIEIDIQYRPVSFLPWYKVKRANLPIHWNELTRKQFRTLANSVLESMNDLDMLQTFLKIGPRAACSIEKNLVMKIRKHLEFSNEREPLNYFVIKKVLWFKSPGPKLKDVPFRALTLGLTYFQDYIQGDKYSLDKFIACFYFKKSAFYDFERKLRRYKGDLTCASEFNESLIQTNAIIIRAEDIRIRQAVVLSFDLICEWLEKVYPYTFNEVNVRLSQNKSLILSDVLERMLDDNVKNIEIRAMQPAIEVIKAIEDKFKTDYKIHGKGHPFGEDFNTDPE